MASLRARVLHAVGHANVPLDIPLIARMVEERDEDVVKYVISQLLVEGALVLDEATGFHLSEAERENFQREKRRMRRTAWIALAFVVLAAVAFRIWPFLGVYIR